MKVMTVLILYNLLQDYRMYFNRTYDEWACKTGTISCL